MVEHASFRSIVEAWVVTVSAVGGSFESEKAPNTLFTAAEPMPQPTPLLTPCAMVDARPDVMDGVSDGLGAGFGGVLGCLGATVVFFGL